MAEIRYLINSSDDSEIEIQQEPEEKSQKDKEETKKEEEINIFQENDKNDSNSSFLFHYTLEPEEELIIQEDEEQFNSQDISILMDSEIEDEVEFQEGDGEVTYYEGGVWKLQRTILKEFDFDELCQNFPGREKQLQLLIKLFGGVLRFFYK